MTLVAGRHAPRLSELAVRAIARHLQFRTAVVELFTAVVADSAAEFPMAAVVAQASADVLVAAAVAVEVVAAAAEAVVAAADAAAADAVAVLLTESLDIAGFLPVVRATVRAMAVAALPLLTAEAVDLHTRRSLVRYGFQTAFHRKCHTPRICLLYTSPSPRDRG